MGCPLSKRSLWVLCVPQLATSCWRRQFYESAMLEINEKKLKLGKKHSCYYEHLILLRHKQAKERTCRMTLVFKHVVIVGLVQSGVRLTQEVLEGGKRENERRPDDDFFFFVTLWLQTKMENKKKFFPLNLNAP